MGYYDYVRPRFLTVVANKRPLWYDLGICSQKTSGLVKAFTKPECFFQVCGAGPGSCSGNREQVHAPERAEEVHGHGFRPERLPGAEPVEEMKAVGSRRFHLQPLNLNLV